MEELILKNLFPLTTSAISVMGLIWWLKFKVQDLEEKINDSRRCDEHQASIVKLNKESVDNKVFQAQVLQKLENLDNKIEMLLDPLQKSIDEIKKKLNIL